MTKHSTLFALTGALTFMATASFSADPMTAAEFEAYVEGKTLYFGTEGTVPYGVEKYLGDRRVLWSFLDGECKDGVWYEEAEGEICFVYEGSPEIHCWSFFEEAGGLRAVFENEPDSTILYEVSDSDDALMCRGPEVGT